MKINRLFLFFFYILSFGIFSDHTTLAASVIHHKGSGGVTWDYYTYVPDSLSNFNKKYIVILCPGSMYEENNDYDYSRRTAYNWISGNTSFAEEYGFILLTMVTPRTEGWYGPMLTRQTLLSDEGWFKRPDFELNRILQQFIGELASNGIVPEPKVFIGGASAGGAFAMRYAFLNPGIVKGVNAGAQGGPIWPLSEVQGEPCTFPLGISDIEIFTGKPFDWASIKQITFRLYIGEVDDNACLGDECWTRAQEWILLNIFGQTPPMRVAHLHHTFLSLGVPSLLSIYHGYGHQLPPDASRHSFEFFHSLAD